MAKLTEKSIAALVCPPGRKDRLVFDDGLPGLAIRIAPSGAKAFLAQYTVAGQKRRTPIGRWGAITLDQARDAARIVLGDVAKGKDPANERAEARAAAVAKAKETKLTLDTLLEEWSTLALAPRRESYRNEALRALRFAFKDHRTRPAAALTRDEAVRVLDAIQRGGKTAIAGRTLAYGRACYAWARKRGMVKVNPFSDLPIAAGTVARDRVLTDDEVRLIWKAAAGLGNPFGPLIQILMLTAQRREEVAGMRWSEISDDGMTWVIPKERAKNGKAHTVHLAPQVQALLAGVARVGKSDLVFTTTGKTPVSGMSKAKTRLDDDVQELRAKAAAEAGKPAPEAIPGWRLHDLRRTAVTWMAGNGVAPHVADRLLNHIQGTISGVAAIYQRGEFLAERKAALEAWAGWVVGIAR